MRAIYMFYSDENNRVICVQKILKETLFFPLVRSGKYYSISPDLRCLEPQSEDEFGACTGTSIVSCNAQQKDFGS